MQMSLIDWIFLALQLLPLGQSQTSRRRERRASIPLGTFMPYFYGDFTRTYAIIPGFYERRPRDPKKARREDVLGYRAVRRGRRSRSLPSICQKLPAGPRARPEQGSQDLLVDPKFIELQAELQALHDAAVRAEVQELLPPLICFLRATLNRDGVPALMQRDVQLTDTGFDFNAVYGPSGLVAHALSRAKTSTSTATAPTPATTGSCSSTCRSRSACG